MKNLLFLGISILFFGISANAQIPNTLDSLKLEVKKLNKFTKYNEWEYVLQLDENNKPVIVKEAKFHINLDMSTGITIYGEEQRQMPVNR